MVWHDPTPSRSQSGGAKDATEGRDLESRLLERCPEHNDEPVTVSKNPDSAADKPTSPVVEAGWTIESGEELAFALEQILESHGVTIAAGSPFEGHVLQAIDLAEQRRAASHVDSGTDIRSSYRSLIGVRDIAKMVLEVRESPSFAALVPHLRLLSEGSGIQTSPSPVRDQATDKLFELFAATLAMQCGTDVKLDDPVRSRGNNPDVLATIRNRRWGIACKALHSLHIEGFITHLTKGIEQIESSEAEVGVVFFNAKNVLPHDEIWPLPPNDGDTRGAAAPRVWPDSTAPFARLLHALQNIGKDLLERAGSDHLSSFFRGKKSVPGFLIWGHSVSAVLIDGKPTVASVRAMNYQHVRNPTPEEMAPLRCLNWAAFADSPTRGPRPL
jgi:hypothetical protein